MQYPIDAGKPRCPLNVAFYMQKVSESGWRGKTIFSSMIYLAEACRLNSCLEKKRFLTFCGSQLRASLYFVGFLKCYCLSCKTWDTGQKIWFLLHSDVFMSVRMRCHEGKHYITSLGWFSLGVGKWTPLMCAPQLPNVMLVISWVVIHICISNSSL